MPRETEWLEFKVDHFDPEEVGRYVSGLANSAILQGEPRAYLIFGVENKTHKIVGTKIKLKAEKKGGEPFENWLTRWLDPRLNLEFVSIDCEGLNVEMIAIDPTYHRPVRFMKEAFIRIDSVLKPLGEYPERERSLWLATSSFAFEQGIALHHLSEADIFEKFAVEDFLAMHGYQKFNKRTAIDNLLKLGFIVDDKQRCYDATNMFV